MRHIAVTGTQLVQLPSSRPIAKELGFAGLWITCDPENAASRRTLELVGAEFIETVDVPSDCVIFQAGHSRKLPILA